MLDMPYFIENEEWYKINPNLGGRAYVLTDKAPAKAVASYEEFYTELENECIISQRKRRLNNDL